MWFPKSAEACLLLGKILRAEATVSSDLSRVERLWRKAMLAESITLPSPIQEKKKRKSILLSSERETEREREEEKKEDDEEREEERWEEEIELVFNQLLQRERAAGAEARESLSLLLSQDGQREEETCALLRRGGLSAEEHTSLPLSVRPDSVAVTDSLSLCAELLLLSLLLLFLLSLLSLNTDPVPSLAHSPGNPSPPGLPLTLYDSFLPSDVLRDMQRIFRPQSSFWTEHHYDYLLNASRTVGYFSYLYPYKERTAQSFIEQVIDRLIPLVTEMFPEVADCEVAEWWVHTRPHSAGHQLHFDSDETHIEDGGTPCHPVATTVLYLSDDIGGPTLVTNQKLGGKLATCGWLCPPKLNRLAILDATYLHGVIPGKGVPNPSLDSENNTLTTEHPPRRLTFMAGFWKVIRARSRGVDTPGAGQHMPGLDSRYHWPQEMPLEPNFNRFWTNDDSSSKDSNSNNSININRQNNDTSGVTENNQIIHCKPDRNNSSHHMTRADPVPVTSVWEPIDAEQREAEDKQNNSSNVHALNSSQTYVESLPTPRYEVCFQGF
eukprot:CAMPEP_0182439880 /NCGR_PEP_ID=MMETSP1167-20130531/86709_1 /TAXON_ID=2988 /ORGANISM="Mallomonas Sp, Strain CCMP3275" /LENGTH=551 /DNA_ID=CAMNT_0024633681 /DNA_START=563 /DNA_END=2219 /DNA_ORIENTATION=-